MIRRSLNGDATSAIFWRFSAVTPKAVMLMRLIASGKCHRRENEAENEAAAF